MVALPRDWTKGSVYPTQRRRNSGPDSVLPVEVTAEDARRFLVAHHMLAPARSVEGGTDGVLEIFRRLGSIQFDPIPVAGRSHDLVLHARVAGYEPAWCDLLYERREIFEAYNKGLSFVPDGRPAVVPRRAKGPGAVGHRRERRGCRTGARAGPGGGAALVPRFQAGERADDRLVRRADEHRPRRARGVLRYRRARACAARGQSPLLRPRRAARAQEGARTRDPVQRPAPAQDAVAVPGTRAARRQRRRRRLQRPRPREARPPVPGLPRPHRVARGARRVGGARRRSRSRA